MDWGGPDFIIAIIAISTIGWLVNNWIRAKHGYQIVDEWGRKIDNAENPEEKRLLEENSRLKDRLEASEDRLAVLESIITDRGYHLADQIEALRDRKPDNEGARN
jgi:hypothetical protein